MARYRKALTSDNQRLQYIGIFQTAIPILLTIKPSTHYSQTLLETTWRTKQEMEEKSGPAAGLLGRASMDFGPEG